MKLRTRAVSLAALLLLLAAAVGGVAVFAGGEPEPGERGGRPPVPAEEEGRAHRFDVRPVVRGLTRPTWVGAAPGDGRALWVAEQPGRVVRVAGARRTVVLDLRDRVRLGAEQGLLGLAFHPDFARNRRFYASWTDPQGDSRVAEFRTGDPEPVRELLRVDQPEENHNGGHVAFGPDGRLYLGLGDGGGAFDPRRTAQDPDSKLGKLLATTVDGPPRWETVLTGLRNPWRFAFDPALGEVWIGDVGQDGFEEVDRVLLEPDEPPKNLGWSRFEGTRELPGGHELGPGELVWPAAVYDHDDGCSITGGPVYAGTRLPALSNRYVYGDFCSGSVWTLRAAPGGGADDVRRERAKVPGLTHIGTDLDGELVLASGSGTLYRAVPAGSG
jgi:glucose/arabinose dehydrogenase